MQTSDASTSPESPNPFDLDVLQRHVPYYLTAEDKKVLLEELRAVVGGDASAANFFVDLRSKSYLADMLQGDGWRGFELYNFEASERMAVRGLVISNSCDVDPENLRDVPSRVIFAPLVKLSAYADILRESGVESGKISMKLDQIRAQRTTNIFYLPAGGPLAEEYIVRLDEASSNLIHRHARAETREKLFMLSNTGFYMLVLKLSIHFCRLQEKVTRRSDVPN